MTFTEEQREAVEAGRTVAMTVEGLECVALRADVHQRIQAVVSDGLSQTELGAMLARSAQ